MKILAAVLMACTSCNYVQPRGHDSILTEGGTTARVLLLDVRSEPIAGIDVELRENVECRATPCPAQVLWTHRSGTDGNVVIPRSFIHELTVVGTPAHEARLLRVARWEQDKHAWTLSLMGRAGFICRQYDSPWRLLVAGDWGSALLSSAQLSSSDEFGLMRCWEEKDNFRKCMGRQIPDAGFTTNFTRGSENDISATVIGETVKGPHEFAKLGCSLLSARETSTDNPEMWSLEYTVDGGLAPIHRGLKLTQAGDLTISNSNGRITGHASAELMTKVNEFLKSARKARPSTPGPDQRSASLTLMSAGGTRELEIPDEIGDLLSQTMDATIRKSIVGSWWESEWKLCHPAAQLTAEQMDVPIQSLVFRDDSHFSVTWRGGGAESPGRPGEPFIWLPDYSGSYTIVPDDNRIHLKVENGIRAARDFSGDGHFQIDDEKLVLKNVWLGTYQAKQKPDICEMTFKRSSAAAIGQPRADK